MTSSMTISRRELMFAALAVLPGAAAAADKVPAVMRADKVTEESLEDALAIPDPKAKDDLTMRGFRPARSGGQPRPFGPGKANLLVTFVTGSSELAPDARQLLDTLGKAMQSNTLAGVSFKIQGHADARGQAKDNDALSLARAQAVAAYLTAQQGVLAERLKPEGRGSREPMNKSKVDAPENRRVTVVSVRL